MRERLFKLLGALILLGSLFLGWMLMGYQSFSQRPLEVGEQGLDLVVEPGTSLAGLAAGLQRQGALDSARYFIWMARFKGLAHSIQAGEYHIVPGTTPAQLLHQLVAGRVVQYSLTIVEGWTFEEMMKAVNAHPELKHTLEGLDGDGVMYALGFAGQHPEGRFYPDTYHFPKGTTDVAFLQRAYRLMKERLDREWAEREEGLPLKTPYEALILASIVEKETALKTERAAIAGVFIRRLKKGMRLQTDPTVIYGLGGQFDGNIRRRDLSRDSPYNTYRHKGLPPTPIAMPSGEAIHAALHPAPGKALYFVSRGDGSHYFSATLEEHNRAVIRYQLEGRSRPFSSHPSR